MSLPIDKGVGYMAWKWICRSLESWMVSWYKNKIIWAGVSNCIRQCLNFFVLNVHIPAYLGWRGKPIFGTYTCCAWAGGTFFIVVLLCQFLVLAGNRFWFYILTYLEYNTVVAVLVFWFWQEIVFGVTYVLSVQYSCAVVSVFWLWQEIALKMTTPFEFLLGYFIMIR